VSNSSLNSIFSDCAKGRTQPLLDALKQCEETHLVDERQHSVLSTALRHGQWQTAQALIDNNYIYCHSTKPLLISACQSPKDETKGIEMALQINDSINCVNSLNRSALMTSCLLGHFNKVEKILFFNANCDLQDHNGQTALMESIHSNNNKIIELILQQNPAINLSNHKNETALIISLKQKSPAENVILMLLEAGADPELRDNDKRSAWLIAKQKHPKISRIIEKHLNTVNQIELPFFSNDYQKIEETKTPTKGATKISTKTKEQAEFSKISNKEESNKNNMETIKSQKTPMIPALNTLSKQTNKKTNYQEWFHAAKIGNLGGLNRMIIEGIDINVTDDKGCTALIRASGHSRRAVVSYLIQQKADIEIRSNNGSTALSSSIIGNCRRVAGLLLDEGANANGLGPSDYSYVTIAAAQWNDAMLSILYRNGADIFAKNKSKQNLLHTVALAAEYYNNVTNAKSTFQFLLDHGMDINRRDDKGNTALMILCGVHKIKYKVDDRNIASLVHCLLKLGAAPAVTNNAGKSALDAVKYHKLFQTKGVLMNALSWNDPTL